MPKPDQIFQGPKRTRKCRKCPIFFCVCCTKLQKKLFMLFLVVLLNFFFPAAHGGLKSLTNATAIATATRYPLTPYPLPFFDLQIKERPCVFIANCSVFLHLTETPPAASSSQRPLRPNTRRHVPVASCRPIASHHAFAPCLNFFPLFS